MPLPIGRVLSCALGILLVVLVRSAQGEPQIKKPESPVALEHLAKGNKLYNVRSFEEASEEYKTGALVEPAPIFDYNLAQCYRQLKRYDDAIWHYERFIKASPATPAHVATAQKLIADMKAELQSKAMTEPPTESAPVAATPTNSASAVVPTATLPAAHLVVQRRASPAPWYADGLGWGLAGAGAITFAIGGGLLWNAGSLNDEANHTAEQSKADELHNTADTRHLLGYVVGAGGAALLVTGVVALAIHPSDDASTSASGIAVASNGVVWFGRF